MTFEEMQSDLFEITLPFGAQPDVPLEAENYFTTLIATFMDRESCRRHLESAVPGMFRCLSVRPDWIQEADWQWFESKPMAYVGSIDAPKGAFHDDARFYVFWSPETGVTKWVIQVAWQTAVPPYKPHPPH